MDIVGLSLHDDALDNSFIHALFTALPSPLSLPVDFFLSLLGWKAFFPGDLGRR
jgi:hypothetical protein